MFKSVNPFTEKEFASHTSHSEEHIQSELARISEAKVLPLDGRLEILRRLSDELLLAKDDLARICTLEMGKPLKQARLEVEKCAKVCEFYAENSEHFLKERRVEGIGRQAAVSLQPLGPLLAIMPWNFPYWQILRVFAPQLALGNPVLLKHSSNVMGCATKLAEVIDKASAGAAVFANFKMNSQSALQLIEDPRIKAVTLTGSVQAGKSVGEAAGRNLKKSVLELGGSDAYVVLQDSDVEKAAKICVEARILNSGQSCIAAKRFIVVQNLVDKFEQCFVEEFKKLVIGDPMDGSVQIGPMAKKDGVDSLFDILERSLPGCEVLYQASVPSEGYFFPPTVVHVKDLKCPVFQEETFGPLAAIYAVPDEEAALRAARKSVFGLGAAVFTEDLEKGWRIAREELSAGSCVVNTKVQSYPGLPFGGIGQSGYGRELAEIGIWEFANVKSVVMEQE